MRKYLWLFGLILIQFTLGANLPLQFIQTGTTSIFQPIFADDALLTQKILFVNQQIKVDVFEGYAVVQADYWFNNPSDATISMLVGFPSCENSAKQNCSELYWLRIMLNNGAPLTASNLSNDSLKEIGDGKILESEKYSSWQVWNIRFLPGVTEVSLNYGVETGKAKFLAGNDSVSGNAFRYSFSNYQWWGSRKDKGEIWLRMNDGYTTKDILGLLPDKKFLAGNSVVHATLQDVMNDSAQEILLWYRKLSEITIIPSHVNWETKFFQVNKWSPDKKILATLSPFSATDYEGKEFQQEKHNASSLLRWSVISGVVVTVLFLFLFIYSYRKKSA